MRVHMPENNTSEISKTLRIRTLPHLADRIGFNLKRLLKIAQNTEPYYVDFKKYVKTKERDLVKVKPPLDIIQENILTRILVRIPVGKFAFGVGKGKSILDNAKMHANAPFVAKMDIKEFYPSIRYTKVHKFFREEQECSPDVARILTLLTTRDYALPLGVSTSPMIANQIVRPVDKRIAGLANENGLVYTRYVDDIAISGAYALESFAEIIKDIIYQSGFKVKRSKVEIFNPNDGKERIITGVRVCNGKTGAPINYVKVLRDELIEAYNQSRHKCINRPFDFRNKYRGRIGYVQWLEPNVGKELLKLYRKVQWQHLEWAVQRYIQKNEAVKRQPSA
jgi:RNA-directed DNA polymerase